jgi:capsular polysaccharide biosynthesis protein
MTEDRQARAARRQARRARRSKGEGRGERHNIGATPEGTPTLEWRNFRFVGQTSHKPRPKHCRPMPEQLRLLEGAVGTPRVVAEDFTYTGALFDRDGEVVEASIRPEAGRHPHRHDGRAVAPADAASVEPREAIYLGSLIHHFGHFLLEILPRLWGLERTRAEVAYFHGWRGFWREPPGFILETIRAVAGREIEVRLIEQPTRFDRIWAPDPLFRIGGRASPEFAAWCQGFAARVASEIAPEAPERIYLTRSRLGERKRRLRGEEEIEEVFSKRSFAIVSPETLPFFEQVRLMRSCRVLAGCEGSALHQAMFMPRGSAVVSLDLRTNGNQFAIEAMQQHRALHLWCLQASGRPKHSEDDLMRFKPEFRPILERELDAVLAGARSY